MKLRAWWAAVASWFSEPDTVEVQVVPLRPAEPTPGEVLEARHRRFKARLRGEA